MEPYVIVFPNQICGTGTPPQQLEITVDGAGIDSNGNVFGIGYIYVYDNSLPQAENFANIKAGIVQQAAASGIKVATNNVTLLMAVN